MSAQGLQAHGSVNASVNRVCVAKRRGRPPIADPNSERSRKPWLAAGVSQRTFYRRKAKESPADQHDAHLVTWNALPSLARLEHRSAARRSARRSLSPEAGTALLFVCQIALGASRHG